MASKPTQRTIADLKKLGWTYQIVERWNAFAKRRIDLFGIIDIVAMRADSGLLGIQATSGANHAARREKSLDEPRLRTWLRAGGRFEIWSYSLRGARGKRKLYELRREEITLPMLIAERGEERVSERVETFDRAPLFQPTAEAV